MKVNFDDKKREFKTLEGITIRQNNLDVLITVKAQEITGKPVFDIRIATKILEDNDVKISLLFNENSKPLTLRVVCMEVLDQPEINDRGQIKEGVEVRQKKAELLKRIFYAKGEIDLKPEEITLIRKLIAESRYLNQVLLQAFNWLDGEKEK